MTGRWERLDTQKIAVGIGFVALGAIMLVNRYEFWAHVWKFWPLWLGLSGVGKVLAHPSKRLLGDGILMIVMCVFFLAVTWNWYGLSYRNSWPLILVFLGLSMVVGSFTGKNHGVVVGIRAGRRTPEDEKEEGRDSQS